MIGRRRPLIKICGITRAEDAEIAVRLGADRIGFVLTDSPRRVALADAAKIAESLPAHVLPVEVFVNPTHDEIQEAFSSGAIRLAQLHGDETPDFCACVLGPWTKAIRAASPADVETGYQYGCAEILIDARVDDAYGGTGNPLPPDVLDAALDVTQRRVFLAGGLGPDTVGSVLQRAIERTDGMRPIGFDASSRLEASPGIKDPERLTGFFEEIERVLESPAQPVSSDASEESEA